MNTDYFSIVLFLDGVPIAATTKTSKQALRDWINPKTKYDSYTVKFTNIYKNSVNVPTTI